MDLALKDIRRHLGKFVATIVGVAMLLSIVLVMNGIYQGNIADGVWLINNTATDLWVVERGRGGPFNESSRMPLDAYKSVAATPGVAKASPLVIYGAQRDINGKSQQFTMIGYDVFGGLGGPGGIVRGRAIEAPHYELVADRKLGLALGDKVPLGTREYTVVGITHGAVDSSGSPLVYLSLPDAQEVQFQQDNRALVAARAASLKRLERAGYAPEQASRLLPLLSTSGDTVNAVLVKLAPGADGCAGVAPHPRLAVLQRLHHRRGAQPDARRQAEQDVGGAGLVPRAADHGLDRDHRADRLRADDREDQVDRHAEADRGVELGDRAPDHGAVDGADAGELRRGLRVARVDRARVSRARWPSCRRKLRSPSR